MIHYKNVIGTYIFIKEINSDNRLATCEEGYLFLCFRKNGDLISQGWIKETKR